MVVAEIVSRAPHNRVVAHGPTLVMNTTLEPLPEKWRAFGWCVADVDGHDVEALLSALASRSGGGS